jgi:hypothetical protein
MEFIYEMWSVVYIWGEGVLGPNPPRAKKKKENCFIIDDV